MTLVVERLSTRHRWMLSTRGKPACSCHEHVVLNPRRDGRKALFVVGVKLGCRCCCYGSMKAVGVFVVSIPYCSCTAHVQPIFLFMCRFRTSYVPLMYHTTECTAPRTAVRLQPRLQPGNTLVRAGGASDPYRCRDHAWRGQWGDRGHGARMAPHTHLGPAAGAGHFL